MRWYFESLAEFGKAIQREGIENFRGGDGNKSWTGEYHSESIAFAISGDTSKVSEAEKLLEKVNAGIELPARQWLTDVVGFFPSVPDYLSGHPECMRRIINTESEHAPIRVFVCTTSSADCDWEKLRNRGVAILAAVMALSRSRPVELWTFSTMHGRKDGCSNVMVKINSNPLQLSEACYALCSIGFDRNLTHAYGKAKNGFNGSWARQMRDGDFGIGPCKEILKGMVCDNDIIIPPTHIADASKILSDPLAWVNKTLERFQIQQDI